jgi:hypothetical protein
MLILTFEFQLGIYGIAMSLMIDYLAIFVSLNVSYLKVVQHIEEVTMNGCSKETILLVDLDS